MNKLINFFIKYNIKRRIDIIKKTISNLFIIFSIFVLKKKFLKKIRNFY